MTIIELQILFDLNYDNKVKILNDVASKIDLGYFFIDSENGHCYLFDEQGNINNINKIKEIKCSYIKNDIEKIIVPNSIKYIEYSAFLNCINLTSITIPDSVKNIKSRSFYNCINLTSITIPNSVEHIGNLAFYNCKNLKSLIFKGKTIDQVKSMLFYPFGIKDESIIKCIN